MRQIVLFLCMLAGLLAYLWLTGGRAKTPAPAAAPGIGSAAESVDDDARRPDGVESERDLSDRSLTHLRFVAGELPREEANGEPWRHHAGRSEHRFMYEIMGAGVVIADFNRDAYLDMLFIQSAPASQGDRVRHPMFLGREGDQWQEAPSGWDVRTTSYGMGGAAADLDNDGWVDLVVTTFDGNDRVFRNTGEGFVDVTETLGWSANPGWSTSIGFVDLNQDRRLDVFIVRYVDYDPLTAPRCYAAGLHVYCTPIIFSAQVDRLMMSAGGGRYDDASSTLATVPAGKGLALAIDLINDDPLPDIFVANDTSPNQLWLNRDGELKELGMEAGVAFNSVGKEEGSMGGDVADLNGDGRADILCTNFQYETTSLYVQASPFFFNERADQLGIGGSARQRLSFGIAAIDADNDGDEDVVVANGHIEDNISASKQGITFAQPDTLYENTGGAFRDVSSMAGDVISQPRVSRGLAVGDLDEDGRLDVVVSVNDGPPSIWLNRTATLQRYVSFWLEGRSGNRSAIGARVTVHHGGRATTRTISGGMSYLSSSSHYVHVGLGDSPVIDRVDIDWPMGERQSLDGQSLSPGNMYRVKEGEEPERVERGRRYLPSP